MASRTKSDTEPGTIENAKFEEPAKATFRLDRIKTVKTVGIDREDFFYPLLTVTVLDPGNWAGLVADEQRLIHAYPETLLSELKRVKPSLGDSLTIDYQGEKKTKQGYTAKVFEVDSPNAAAFDWDTPDF